MADIYMVLRHAGPEGGQIEFLGPFLSSEQLHDFMPLFCELKELKLMNEDLEFIGTVENWISLKPFNSCLNEPAFSVWDEVGEILDRRHLDYATARLEGFQARKVEQILLLEAQSYLEQQKREFEKASRLSKEFEALGIPKIYHRDSYKELA